MKIAVTSKGTDLQSQVDPRFGRAAFILIVDSETMKFEVLNNSANADAFKGAGIQAASMISNRGAEILLTGYCGPNAFKTLNAAGIKFADNVTGSVREAVEQFQAGKLNYATAANVEGHW